MTASHAPATAWLRTSEMGSTFAIRLLIAICRLLGRGVTRLLLAPIVLYFIAFAQPTVRLACDGFQLWTLTVDNDGAGPGATLTCRPDSDQEAVITERIEHTDFPLAHVKLYVIDNVALLPDEY